MFGSNEKATKKCELVEFRVQTKENDTVCMSALVVPFICEPLIYQPTMACAEQYQHLQKKEALNIDLLVGSDHC